jgi:hypothetical protein
MHVTRYITQKSGNEVLVNKGTTQPINLTSDSTTDEQFLESTAEAFELDPTTLQVVTTEPDISAGTVEPIAEVFAPNYTPQTTLEILKELVEKYGSLEAALASED